MGIYVNFVRSWVVFEISLGSRDFKFFWWPLSPALPSGFPFLLLPRDSLLLKLPAWKSGITSCSIVVPMGVTSTYQSSICRNSPTIIQKSSTGLKKSLQKSYQPIAGITFNLFSFSHTSDRMMESTVGENMSMNIRGRKLLEIQISLSWK